MFSTTQRVRLSDTDASGVLFFPNQFLFAQNLVEDFFISLQEPLPSLLKKLGVLLTIVHAESNYLKSVQMGDVLTSSLTLEKLGTTSFTLALSFELEGAIAGTSQLVFVTINPLTRQKTEIPPLLKELLTHIS